MASENETKKEKCAKAAAEAYRSSPIKVDGLHNSLRITDTASGDDANTDQQNFRSNPIGVEGLRNSLAASSLATNSRRQSMVVESLRSSLRSSFASKRKSMTIGEIQFVENMLDLSLQESELEAITDVINCDKTFFHHPSAAAEDGEHLRKMSVLSAPGHLVGSQRRQENLEARKKLAAEQSRKRATSRWKKAGMAARLAGRLSVESAPADVCPEELPQQRKASLKNGMARNEAPLDGIKEAEREESTKTLEELEESEPVNQKPVIYRRASSNNYGGEGFEIGTEDLFTDDAGKEEKKVEDEEETKDETPRSFSALSVVDEVTHTPRHEGFRRASFNIYGGLGFEVAAEDLFEEVYDGDERKSYEEYDPWLFQDFDKFGKKRDFTILGTSHDDHDCHPHVLSPVQMDRFQPFLPDIKKGESFWLKYSLVRDGCTTISFLKQVRASPYTLLAIETVDGEVFGGFFGNAWTIQPSYFGMGNSFLWRMKHIRNVPEGDSGSFHEGSLVEQIEKESDLEIFPAELYYCNQYYQMCTQDKIAAGGGATSIPQDFGPERGGTYAPHEIGYGLHLGTEGSLLEGTSAASMTFRNPPLSRIHKDGSKFEILNMEVWGFTPCQTEDEARILEFKNMFFKKHSSGSIS